MPRHAVFGVGQGGGAGAGRGARVLVYGDSLTAGFPDFEPYAKGLVAACAAEAQLAVRAVGCGLCGLTARDMARQSANRGLHDLCGRSGIGLRKLLEDESQDEGPFDLVLVMAGTNDVLSESWASAAIVEDIQRLHTACHELGARTVALAMPDFAGATASPDRRAAWAEANRLLEEWVHEASAPLVVAFVDSPALMPFDGGAFWEPDGVHWTTEGSAFFGAAVSRQLLPKLRALVDPASPEHTVGAAVVTPPPATAAHAGEGADADTARTAEGPPARRLLVLGGTAASGAGTAPGADWASLLCKSALARGYEAACTKAFLGSGVADCQAWLCDDSGAAAVESSTTVVLALAPSADEPAPEAADDERELLEALKLVMFTLRGMMAPSARLVLCGPLPVDAPSGDAREAQVRARERIAEAIGAWADADADCFVDFLRPAARGVGVTGPLGQDDASHARLFACIDLDAVLGQA